MFIGGSRALIPEYQFRPCIERSSYLRTPESSSDHDFRDGRSRYEPVKEEHHDHLIDLRSGNVIEFSNTEIEKLQAAISS